MTLWIKYPIFRPSFFFFARWKKWISNTKERKEGKQIFFRCWQCFCLWICNFYLSLIERKSNFFCLFQNLANIWIAEIVYEIHFVFLLWVVHFKLCYYTRTWAWLEDKKITVVKIKILFFHQKMVKTFNSKSMTQIQIIQS